MRLVVSHYISLDGVVQAPGDAREDPDGGFRHGGWSIPYVDDPVLGDWIDATMATTGGLLLGRRTYEAVAATWAARPDDERAERLAALPTYVASRTLTPADLTSPNTTLLDPSRAIADVRRLKARPGDDLVVMGSADLARQLIADGLVDEYRLVLEPLLLGGGKRIFPEDTWKRVLRLESVTRTDTDALLLVYRPA